MWHFRSAQWVLVTSDDITVVSIPASSATQRESCYRSLLRKRLTITYVTKVKVSERLIQHSLVLPGC